jgi:hypothetical protein
LAIWENIWWRYVMPKTVLESMVEINEEVRNLDMPQRMDNFKRSKLGTATSTGGSRWPDEPHLGRRPTLKLAVSNAQFLRNAERFGRMATTDAESVISPILYYYSLTFLNSFFTGMIFQYEFPPSNHGLEMKWSNSLEDIGVVIRESGQFVRLIDAVCLLKADTPFQQLKIDLTPKPSPVTAKYKLRDLFKLRTKLHGYTTWDLADYLVMYAASNLARYRPQLWDEILRAETNELYSNFARVFQRHDRFMARLVCTVHQISLTGSPGLFLDKTYKVNVAKKIVFSRARSLLDYVGKSRI